MANKVLSIEVGYTLTRLVLTDYKVKNPKVYQYASIPTPPGVVTDGELHLTQEYINDVNSTIYANKMACKSVVFPIASSKIATREVPLPPVKENKIDAMIRANAKDYFPIDLDQYELGYSVLGKSTDTTGKEQVRVQVMVAPKTLIEGYRTLAKGCGMDLLALDYSGNSIYQMVKNDCKSGVQLVIQADEQSTVLTVLNNQSIVLQRSIAYGISEAVMTMTKTRVFDVHDYKSAYELASRKTCIKRAYNAQDVMDMDDDEEEDAAYTAAKEAVTAAFSTMIGGISRVIDFYNSRNTEAPIERVLLTGPGAEFSGLSKLLTNELGIRVKILKDLENANIERTFKDGHYSQYFVCIGASIAPVGFISESKGKGKGDKASDTDKSYMGIAWTLFGGGLFVAIILLAFSAFSYIKTYAEYQANVIRLNELAPVKEIYARYLTTQNSYNDVMAMYGLTENSNEDLLAFLEELEQKMPSDIHVTSFTSALDTVTISAEIGTKEAMANAVQQLRAFNSLSSLSVMGVQDEIDEEGSRTVTFTVVGTYKTQEELKAEEEAQAQ